MRVRVAKSSLPKLTTRAVFLAITILTLVGLNAFTSMTTIAQGPPREIDLRDKLKNKKFTDGRRVVLDTLASGEKIAAEIKDGVLKDWFLIAVDGTEVKAEVKKKITTTSTTAACTATFVTTTTTTDRKGHATTTSTSTLVGIPCPPDRPQNPNGNSNSNSN